MVRTILPIEVWSELGMDLTGPFPSGEHILVVVDYYSRFFEAKILKRIDSGEVIRALEEIFLTWGYPKSILSDNGRQFTSKEFHDYCKQHGIEIRHSIPYTPRINGEVERVNRTLGKILTISHNSGSDWRKSIKKYIFDYGNTPHTVTGVPPLQLMLGRKARDGFPILGNLNCKIDDDKLRQRDAAMKEKGREYGNKKNAAKPHELKIGDYVFAKNITKSGKLVPNFDPNPLKIVNDKGDNITLETSDGTNRNRHASHLIKVNKELAGNDKGITSDEVSSDEEQRHEKARESYQNNHNVQEKSQLVNANNANESITMFNPIVRSTPIPNPRSENKATLTQPNMKRRLIQFERPKRMRRAPDYFKF